MDRCQNYNELLVFKIIDKHGEAHTKFTIIGEVTHPGAAGHLKALKQGANDTVGLTGSLRAITHLSTDGENKNVGSHNGLWKLIEDEHLQKCPNEKPLLKSVCTAHS